MHVTFHCPRCSHATRQTIAAEAATLRCGQCSSEIAIAPSAAGDPKLTRCRVCDRGELFLRKDFSQKIGLSIVVAGVVLSSIAWAWHWRYATYGILFAAALLDLAVYACVGNLLECYYCKAEYREVPGLDSYEPFDLEVHERHRQQRIRLAEQESAQQGSA